MSHCAITEINEDSWSEILRIQAEVYIDIEPESLATLRSKWLNSPQCCWLFSSNNEVCAYLLAHAWHSDSPPKLYQSAPALPNGDILFIHDLAVSKTKTGKGIGHMMVTHLLNSARTRNFRKVLLVAVQNSVPFWQKLGFELDPENKANTSYGDEARVLHLFL